MGRNAHAEAERSGPGVPAGAVCPGPVPASPWTAREQEFLAVTVRLLQEHGYDRLSLEDVATEAKASKATLYRRWPSKAELVLAAFIESTRAEAVAPHTGSLRGNLIAMGELVCEHSSRHVPTMRALLNEIARSPALTAAFQEQFIDQRHQLMRQVLDEAVRCGEIDKGVVNDEIWDVLPGYLVFRTLLPGSPPTPDTVRQLVDDVMLPSLLRHR